MLYHFFYPLSKYFFIFNVLKYITFRGACSFLTSFLLVMFFYRGFVEKLRSLSIGENVNMYGHEALEKLHKDKKGTPTMGGVLIIFAVFVSSLLWTRWDNSFVLYALLTMLCLGLVGLRDDFIKAKRGKGLGRGEKLFLQILVALILSLVIFSDRDVSTILYFPFLKNLFIDLGYLYIFWSMLVLVSTSNAVNFTDGLDGLAIGTVISNCLVFAVISYIVGNIKFAQYLFIPYVKEAGELSIICASLVGAGLGFLWFNSYPAQIFMGDVGALSLGGVIGMLALLTKKEFLLIFTGGIFVIEALTVVLQIFSVRLRGKKMFRAAPLHLHLQLLGWSESKVVIRLWILSIILAVLSLITLKLR
ncbi:MAG: phospho-N-acetylmuramoyl-pentapeptide-transferase [Candidatus Omnitrophica bacterium]|nr:phospho-N-acetylmuramoyl-pentapeptide-transferase [Candidatus Omnitrophota bacterium]